MIHGKVLNFHNWIFCYHEHKNSKKNNNWYKAENEKNIVDWLVFIVMIYYAVGVIFWTGDLGEETNTYLAIFMLCNGLN